MSRQRGRASRKKAGKCALTPPKFGAKRAAAVIDRQQLKTLPHENGNRPKKLIRVFRPRKISAQRRSRQGWTARQQICRFLGAGPSI
jgi:hypothetical protein